MATPQIVSLPVGRHAAEMGKTTERLIKGGTWKKQRVIVILPSADLISAKVSLSHWSMAFPPNQPCHRVLALGMEIGHAYSQTIAEVINHPELSQWEFILTLEADNMPPPDGLVKLIEDMEQHPEFVCIGGLYFTKGEGGVAQIWGDPRDPILNYRPQPPIAGQLVECCGTGMGFNLWRMSLFKDARLRQPWFRTLNGMNGEGIGTQDLYFWTDARKYGYRCAVDCRITVGHYDLEGKFGPPDTVW